MRATVSLCAARPPTAIAAAAAAAARGAMGTMAPAAPLHRTWDPHTRWDPEVEAFLVNALGQRRLAAITAALGIPPLTTCLRVNTTRTTPEALLRRLPEALSPEDRDLLQQPGHTPFLRPDVPMAVFVPGSGPHAVDDTPTNGLEVILGRLAGEAVLRGANPYAPGILACSAGISPGDLVAVSVGLELPGGSYGVTRRSVLEPDLPLDDPRFPDRARLFLGVGRAVMSRAGMCAGGGGLAVAMVDRVFNMPSIGDALRGEAMLQNLPSLVAALVLGPAPGSNVLDMCAAPGGKTTALAALMGDRGQVIALDRSHPKVVGIQQLAQDLGLTCVQAMRADSTRLLLEEGGGGGGSRGARVEAAPRGFLAFKAERVAAKAKARGEEAVAVPRAENSDGFPPDSFDHVLLDAPCTALGLRPRLLLPQTLPELRSTAGYQRQLLDVAARLVRPGGTLVYSTCTINPDENEANVRYALDKFPDLRLVPQTPRLGGPGLSGSVAAEGGGRRALLTEEEAALVQRFDPAAELDTPGFFIAKFERRER